MPEAVASPEAVAAPVVTPATGSWRETFADPDVKGSASLDKFKGKDTQEILGNVAKAYVNLEKMPRGVAVPKDDAKPEEWDSFYEKIGRPKTPAEYGLDIKVPEGIAWSPEAQATVTAKLHAAGLTKKQAQVVVQGYLEEAVKGNTALQQIAAKSRSDAEKTMRDEWGGLADMNISLVQRAVAEFGGDEFRQHLDESGLGNDPRFMRFVYQMARPMLEDGLIRGEGLGMKRSEAQSEINRIMRSEEYLGKKGRESQQAAVAKISELYPIAHGE